MTKGVVYYQSVRHGLSNLAGAEAITYFGKVFRIPRSQYGKVQQIEWELPPDELMARIAAEAQNQRMRPIDGAVIERHEVYDRDDGDVWVMYRVPCEQET